MNKRFAAIFPNENTIIAALPIFEDRTRILNIYSPIPFISTLKERGLLKETKNDEMIIRSDKTEFYDQPVLPLKGSRGLLPISLFTLIGSILGLLVGFWLQYSIHTINYKINYGGKPFFNPVFSIPVIFELSILFATLLTFIGFLLRTGLPRWYSDYNNFIELNNMALNDKYVIVFETDNPEEIKQEGIEILPVS